MRTSKRHIGARRLAAMLEQLESRRLLSTINWTNKGTGAGAGDTDGFNAIYGANAATARLLAQRAIDDWEEVIVDFNYAGGGNTFTLNLGATAFTGGLRGQTNNIGVDNAVSRKPDSATIRIDDNAGGNGWYFDPNVGSSAIPDDSEFTTFATRFDSDGPGLTGFDFYRTCLHELAHAMGILNSSGGLRIGDFITNTGLADPNEGGETILAVNWNGGANDYTMTTSGGGHLHEGPNPGGYTGPTHPNDLINAGRAVPTGTRRLISDTDALLLRNIYDYTITLPSTINTFYANLNRTSNVLNVRGDAGTADDNITLTLSGTNLNVQVNGTSELIPVSEFTQIVVNGNGGEDTIRINSLPATAVSLVVNGGDGNDGITIGGTGAGTGHLITLNGDAGGDSFSVETLGALSFDVSINGGTGADILNASVNGDYDTQVDGNIRFNGGSDDDTLLVNDTTDGANSDTINITKTTFAKLIGGTLTFASGSFNAPETFIYVGSDNADTINIEGVRAETTLTAFGSNGNDTFNVGNGNLDVDVLGTLQVRGGNFVLFGSPVDTGTADRVNFDDTANIAAEPYTIAAGALGKTGLATPVSFGQFERVDLNIPVTALANSITIDRLGQTATSTAINVNGNAGNDTLVIDGVEADDTINAAGGDDNDLFDVGGTSNDIDSALSGVVVLAGSAGIDSLSLVDSGDASADDAYTIGDSTFSKSSFLAGASLSFTSMSDVNLLANGGSNLITIDGILATVDLHVNGNAGDDTVTTGPDDIDLNWRGSATLGGGTGVDLLDFDDSGDGTASAYVLTASTFRVSASSAGATQPFQYAAFDALVITGGFTARTVNVDGVSIPLTVNGGDGNDTVVVGNGNFDANIDADVDVFGADGADRLVIDDAADLANANYTINGRSFTKSTSPAVTVRMGSPIILGLPTIEEFVLNASSGSGAIALAGQGGTTLALPPNPPAVKAVDVTINGGGGDDAVTIATGGVLASLRGDIVVNGGADNDSLLVNDLNDTGADTYTLTGTTIVKSDRTYGLAYGDFERTTLDANDDANTITMASGGSGWRINGNGGVDLIDVVGNQANTFVTVTGGAGLDTVRLNNDNLGIAGIEFVEDEDLALLDIHAGGTVRVTGGGTTTIATNDTAIAGSLDLADNYFIDKGPKPIGYFDTLLRAGYAGGAWNGGQPSIRSSVAATALKANDALGVRLFAGLGAFGGVTVNANDIGIGYTIYGDTDLDKDVDFDDLLSLAQNYGATPPRFWYQGNFNYDPGQLVTFDDLLLLAQNYGMPALQADWAAAQAMVSATVPATQRRRISSDIADLTVVELPSVAKAYRTVPRDRTAIGRA